MLRRSVFWIRDEAAFLVVVLTAAVGFAYVLAQPGSRGRSAGTGSVASALLLAGLLRLLLPTLRVGMLAVRGRIFDALCYLTMGGALLGLDIRVRG